MTEPRILLWDLETNGVNARHPDLGFVTHFGYKWLDEKKVHSLTFDKFNGYQKHGYSDKDLLAYARGIIDQADMLVAHYGDYFDRKFLNGRLMINGLDPIPNVIQFDTCRKAWKYFNFSGNRLKQLAKFLGCENQKGDNEFPGWWHRVMAGDKSAIKLMAKYNKQDVLTLEGVYLKMRPFVPEHVKLFTNGQCRICGGFRTKRGTLRTQQLLYQRYQCQRCGTWDKGKRVEV